MMGITVFGDITVIQNLIQKLQMFQPQLLLWCNALDGLILMVVTLVKYLVVTTVLCFYNKSLNLEHFF